MSGILCLFETRSSTSVAVQGWKEHVTNVFFPLTEEETKSHGICPTDTSLTYAAGKGKLSCVKELIAVGADVNISCECHGNGPLVSAVIGKTC